MFILLRQTVHYCSRNKFKKETIDKLKESNKIGNTKPKEKEDDKLEYLYHVKKYYLILITQKSLIDPNYKSMHFLITLHHSDE